MTAILYQVAQFSVVIVSDSIVSFLEMHRNNVVLIGGQSLFTHINIDNWLISIKYNFSSVAIETNHLDRYE